MKYSMHRASSALPMVNQRAPADTKHLPASFPSQSQPTHAEIANRAFGIYIQSGSQAGHCRENWEKAERSLAMENQFFRGARECGCEDGPDNQDYSLFSIPSIDDDIFSDDWRRIPARVGKPRKPHGAQNSNV
ncbi:MAG TPA: DUF2934 domain-containing protein [Planctomycetota bacterium]|nr:DUF2934 domain-containing protein [Planctomycetota bacterium]